MEDDVQTAFGAPWTEITQSRFWHEVETVSPEMHARSVKGGDGYLTGDPWIHRTCKVCGTVCSGSFLAYFLQGSRYFGSSNPLTHCEFIAVAGTDLSELAVPA